MVEKEHIKGINIFLIMLRTAVILLLIATVIPALNPARMSGLINKSYAFITMAVSYSSITSGFTRALNRGWVEESPLKIIYIS